MGLDNPLHIAFLVIILLLVFGAKRLPEIGPLARLRHARVQGFDQRRVIAADAEPDHAAASAGARAAAGVRAAGRPGIRYDA